MTTVVYHGNLPTPPPVPSIRFLSSYETRPALLVERLRGADQLVILDPISFPYEFMTDEHRDIPIVVQLPPEPEDDVLSLVLGEQLFSHLTPFDSMVLDRVTRHDFYRKRYRIGSTRVLSTLSPALLTELASRPSVTAAASAHLRGLGRDPSAWNLPSKLNKATYRLQSGVINSILRERPDLTAPRREVKALLAGRVSSGVLSMLPEGLVSAASVLDLDSEAVAARTVDWPDFGIAAIGPQLKLPFPPQQFDLVFLPWLYSGVKLDQWAQLTSEIVRVSRPGGLIVILDRFVPRLREAPVIAMNDLLGHLAEDAPMNLTIRDLYSLTYPYDSGPSDAALVLAPLGTFKRL